jgi:phage baseplate assembly protein gpV
MSQWLQFLSQSLRRGRRTARSRRTLRGKLRVEILEDRTLPTAVFWTNPGSGLWNMASNWSSGRVPGAADDVFINASNINVQHTANTADSIHSLTCNATLFLSAGSLTLGAAPMGSTLNNMFVLDGGTISGPGDLTVNGLLNWSGGALSGTGRVEANGGMQINTVGGPNLNGRILDNAGEADWVGNGTFFAGNNAVFNNLTTGTFIAQGNGTFSGMATFNNAGSFLKMGGTGTTVLGTTLHNSGSVEVRTGALNLNANQASTGVFTVDAGATLNFGGGTQLLEPASSVGGDGSVTFSGSNLILLGSYSVNGGTTISGGTTTFDADVTLPTLTLSNGTLGGPATVTVTGMLTWTGGTMSGSGQTNANGGIAMSGNNDKGLDGRTLNNAGTATMTGNGNVVLTNYGAFNNLATGTVALQSDAAFRTYSIFTTPGTFNNAGMFVKSAGNGVSYMSQCPFNNTGTVEVASGTLDLAGGGVSSGAFLTDAGSILEFGAAAFYLTANSSISGAGDMVFDSETFTNFSMVDDGSYNVSGTTTLQATNRPFAYPYVQFDKDVTMGALNLTAGAMGDYYGVGSLVVVGNLTVNGLLTWTAGHMSGGGHTIANGGITISGDAIKTLDGRILDNAGTATWSNASNFNMSGGASWNNLPGGTFAGNFIVAGTFVFGSDTTLPTLTLNPGGTLGGTATVTVTGMLTWTGGTMNGGGRTIANGGLTISGNDGKGLDHRILDNAGTATWSGSGNIGLSGGAVWNNLASATFSAQASATISGGGTTFNNAGYLQRSATGTTTFGLFFNNTGTLDVAGGTLTLAAGGSNRGVDIVEAGASLAFSAGSLFVSPDAFVGGDGDVLFSGANVEMLGTYAVTASTTVSNGTVSFDAAVNLQALTLSGGTLTGAADVAVIGLLTWTGGTMSGIGNTYAYGGMILSGNGRTLDGRTLNNAATATWTGSAGIAFLNGAVWNNLTNAVLDVQSTAGANGAGQFLNLGTILKTTGTGTAGLGVALNNLGTVNVGAGRLTVSNGVSNTGSVTLGPGGTLDMGNGVYFQADGLTVLNGGTLIAGTVDLEGGVLSGPGTIGSTATLAAVTNSARVNVGATGVTGTLTINGTYTQTAAGTLVIQVGGSTPGTDTDKLVITRQATLDGSLTVTLLNGFVPGPLQIVTFMSHTGVFATLDGDAPDYMANYAAGSLTLT